MHESKEEDTQRMEGATLPFHTSTLGFRPPSPPRRENWRLLQMQN